MPKSIDPLNPEELKAAIAENKPSEQPVAPQNSPDTNAQPELMPTANTLPIQNQPNNSSTIPMAPAPSTLHEEDLYERSKKRYKLINLALFSSVIVIILGFIGWHFWGSQNIKSGNNILSLVKPRSNPLQQDITNIDTSNWHTIRSDKYHYTFKYPSNDSKRIWRYYPPNGPVDNLSTGVESGLAQYPNYYPLSIFNVEIVPIGSSIDKSIQAIYTPDSIKQMEKDTPTGTKLKISQRNVTKNDVYGLCYDRQFNNQPNWDTTACRFPYKDRVYIFNLSAYGTDNVEKQYKNTGSYSVPAAAEKIFDTFQFL